MTATELVLRMLRLAGARGVPYVVLRDRLGGENPEPVLDDLRAAGYLVPRTPGRDGAVLAVLVAEPEGRAA